MSAIQKSYNTQQDEHMPNHSFNIATICWHNKYISVRDHSQAKQVATNWKTALDNCNIRDSTNLYRPLMGGLAKVHALDLPLLSLLWVLRPMLCVILARGSQPDPPGALI